MKFNGFDWDEGNIGKCAKHGVEIEAIEQLFHGEVVIFDDPSEAEERHRAIGKDEAGCYIFIVFCFREKDGLNLIRPISARYMHQKEIDYYERQN